MCLRRLKDTERRAWEPDGYNERVTTRRESEPRSAETGAVTASRGMCCKWKGPWGTHRCPSSPSGPLLLTCGYSLVGRLGGYGAAMGRGGPQGRDGPGPGRWKPLPGPAVRVEREACSPRCFSVYSKYFITKAAGSKIPTRLNMQGFN